MNANGLRENSRVQVCVSEVLLTLPIPLLFVTLWGLPKCSLNLKYFRGANSNMTVSGHI